MKTRFFAVALLLAVAQAALAGDVSYVFHEDTSSQYMFRGVQVEQNMVVQPYLTASKDDVSVGIWTNYNTIARKDDEIDAWVNVTKTVGKFTGTLGFEGYFVLDVFNTYEFNLGLSYEDLSDVTLLSVYDFHLRKGLYEELAYSPKIHVFKTPLFLTVATAFNVHYNRVDTGFTHAYASLSWPILIDATYAPNAKGGTELPTTMLKLIPAVYHQEPLANDFKSVTTATLSLDYEL